jgi:16S rRNA (guanine966-N2)-methyltransferase
MGLEALSRGFGKVTVCELNKKSAQIIKLNYESLGLKPDLYIGDSLKLLNKFPKSYDVTYIDPPFKSGIYKTIINQIKSGIIIAESDLNEDFSEYTIIKEKIYGSVKITFIKK